MSAGLLSPYDFNASGFNPLKTILKESIDFDELADTPIHLFVTAINVYTGRGRVFKNADVTENVLLASACLLSLFQAVTIDGEPYWDSGYSGNPTITRWYGNANRATLSWFRSTPWSAWARHAVPGKF